jgi:hypothetical protein
MDVISQFTSSGYRGYNSKVSLVRNSYKIMRKTEKKAKTTPTETGCKLTSNSAGLIPKQFSINR